MAAAGMQSAALAPTAPSAASADASSRMTPGAPAGPTMADPRADPLGRPSEPEPPKKPGVQQDAFRAEAAARLEKQLQARAGFVERLVAFWSNHFAVSVAKSGELRAVAGAFEREAIRPNVLGPFSALLHGGRTVTQP